MQILPGNCRQFWRVTPEGSSLFARSSNASYERGRKESRRRQDPPKLRFRLQAGPAKTCINRVTFLSVLFLFLSLNAWAEVSIETSVSRSRLAIGEELSYEIIVLNAEGNISNPMIGSINGFNSYSQGRSQEISIVNGRSSSRSIFSYVLIANSVGKKTIGPFEILIAGKRFKIASVDVEVVPDNGMSQAPSTVVSSQMPGAIAAPPSRALPGPMAVSNQDIFVRAWLDKDEVFVNEPAMLTYTIYTRLSATYKGFEKEPVTTGFWVEDFPPERTVQKTEQILNGSRYVVADVRKMALFPTQAGVFTIDPGILSAMVEVREQDDFDSFFSYNIFGRRGPRFPSSFVSQVYNKSIPAQPIQLTVKALPELDKPSDFSGAVGQYRIESSIDKKEVEAGTPVTLRVRISGQGNINILQTPAVPKLEDFKIYDSSSSVNISKERLVVEGEKITETVLVPKKAATVIIPALGFSYFDPISQNYKELKTNSHTLVVKPSTEQETEPVSVNAPIEPVAQEDVAMVGKDIRYIKMTDDGRVAGKPLYQNSLYWMFDGTLFLLFLIFAILFGRQSDPLQDLRGLRLRRSHHMARKKLKKATRLLKKGSDEAFYTEISRAVHGYFADKLNIPDQSVNVESIEEGLADPDDAREVLSQIRTFFDEAASGRFSTMEKSEDEKKDLYKMADEIITAFEKVKLK